MKRKSRIKQLNEGANAMAKRMALHCYRNTFIETLHAGIFPTTQAGDYSDVKVIDGMGQEIPWNKISRISDDEMYTLNKEVVNKMYTYLVLMNDEYANKMIFSMSPTNWDNAELDKSFLDALELFKKRDHLKK